MPWFALARSGIQDQVLEGLTNFFKKFLTFDSMKGKVRI